MSEIFAEIFEEPDLIATDELTAHDVENWTSLTHIDMICAVEEKLDITFVTAEISRLANTGELLEVILNKVNAEG